MAPHKKKALYESNKNMMLTKDLGVGNLQKKKEATETTDRLISHQQSKTKQKSFRHFKSDFYNRQGVNMATFTRR